MAVNSRGVHPESLTPFLALCASCPRWTLQGVASLQVVETPIIGRLRSSSVRPIALYIARCGALAAPSTTLLLGSSMREETRSAYFKIELKQRSGYIES